MEVIRPPGRRFRRRAFQMPDENSTRMNCSALLTCFVHPVADLGLRLSDEAVRALRCSLRDARSRDAFRRSLDAEVDCTAGSATASGAAIAAGAVAAASVARWDLDGGSVSATRSDLDAGGAAAASLARSALAGG